MKAFIAIAAVALAAFAFPAQVSAATKVVKATYAMPKCTLAKSKCPEVDPRRVVSDDPWVTTTMDRLMYPPCWSDMDGEARKGCTLQQDVNSFAAQSADSVREGSPPWSYSVEPAVLKDWGRLKQFSVRSDIYTGGAHGNPNIAYIVLDPKSRRQLKLTDVMTPAGMARLRSILREKNRQRLLDQMPAGEIADYLQLFKFEMTENFVFGRKGLDFLYNVYEIGPYVEGQIAFTVPYSQLRGLMKPDFYPPASYLRTLGR